LLGVFPGVARAQEPPPIIVFHAPANPPEAVARARTALHRVARERGTAVIDLSPVAEPPAEAARHLGQAIEAYHNFKYDAAHESLQRALAEAGDTGARGLSASELTDIYLYSALVAAQRGDSTRSWDHFVHAATIDPTRRLDPVRFPPRVIESYQRAIDAVAAAGRASIKIAVDASCAVAIDARAASPGSAVRVAQGHHYVRVDCPGHLAHGARLMISEAEVVIAPALEAPVRPTPERAVEVASERGARTVILALAQVSSGAQPTLRLRLLDARTGKERASVFTRIGESAAADIRGAVQDLIDQVVAPAPAIVFGVSGPAGPSPWYGRPWVWGVAGAAVTTAILLPFVLRSDDVSGFRVTPRGELPW
jgi:hypothetical protein